MHTNSLYNVEGAEETERKRGWSWQNRRGPFKDRAVALDDEELVIGLQRSRRRGLSSTPVDLAKARRSPSSR